MNRPIVVGVDASRASCDAVFWALAEARRRACEILFVHALDAADAELATTADLGTPAGAAAAVLSTHRRHARRLAPDVATHGVIAHRRAPDALIELSRRASLVVVGNTGRLGLAVSALGSVSQRVAEHAHCPVVVVPRGSSRLVTRRVAVGLAETHAGRLARDFAADEADRWAATLALVRVGDPAEDEQAGQAALARAAAPVRREHPSVVAELVAPRDDVTTALLREASRSDLLVLGCRHSDSDFGCRLGAVPTAVLGRAPCPVVLVGQVAA